MLTGSIAGLGSHFLIGLRAENCNTGDVLATVQAEAESREQVLKVLNKAASSMRGQLGESLASVQKYDTPVEQATTPSIEALQAYGLGRRMQDTLGDKAAVPFYKRAIELDPNFAMAYARLGVAYTNLSEQSLSAANFTKAFELRERTSEKEKLYISGQYYRQVTGDLPKAISAFTVFSQIYPREPDPHENLSAIFSYVGRYDEALAETLQSLQLDPGNGGSYANCATIYCSLNQFEKMRTALHDAEATGLKSDPLPQVWYMFGFLTHNANEMKQQVDSSSGKPGSQEPTFFQLQSDTESYFGRLEDARVYTKRAMDSDREASGSEQATFSKLIGSLHETETGYQQRGLLEARAAAASDKDLLIVQAMALARAGDGSHARSIADNLDKQYPSDTTVQYYWLPAIRSAIELEAGNPERAIELLQPAEQYELGGPIPFFGPMYPIYLRGLAYLKAGRGHDAIREFQKILAHQGIGQNFVTSALSQLQLARALAMDGDRPSARKAYQSFFELWKDADASVPILVEAKAEYSRMN
jgi:tetratricopeptide (TPR) repeat protein